MAKESIMTQQKINVLFVIHGLGAGGSERVVLNLARALDRSKFQVFLAAFAGGALEQSFEKSCERIFYIHKKEGFDINAIIQLYQIIKDYSIDIINAHHFMPFFYSFAGCKILGRKVCVFSIVRVTCGI
jgi:glycosyltransferase involved in cell wall biosynthesis